MRILFLSQKYLPQKGGVAVSAARISRGISSQAQVDAMYLSRDLRPGTLSSEQNGKLSVYRLGETDNQAETLQLLELAAQNLARVHQYDAIIGFYAVPVGAVAVYVGKQLGIPSVICLRGNDVDRAFYHYGRSGLLQWTLSHATKLVAVSKELAKKAGIIADRGDVLFIPNSVDSEVFFPEPTESQGPPKILFSGDMRFKKGLEVLLESLHELEGEWELIFAGGMREESRQVFESWCSSHQHLAKRIKVLKYNRNEAQLRKLYNQATVVVNTALWEGMPNSVLEAMACGKAVLATAVGGVCDLITDGESGCLVSPHCLDTFGDRLNELLKSPTREAMGQRAREHVMRHHSPELESQTYLELLTQLGQ